MPLIDRNKMPAGGFFYREESLKWETPNAFLPFTMIARQIQTVRVANPTSGLNPEFNACCNDLDAFTCARLENNPRWCAVPIKSPSVKVGVKQSGRCAACGGGKKKKK